VGKESGVGSGQWAVGSWQSAVGSWQSAVGSRQSAVGQWGWDLKQISHLQFEMTVGNRQ